MDLSEFGFVETGNPLSLVLAPDLFPSCNFQTVWQLYIKQPRLALSSKLSACLAVDDWVNWSAHAKLSLGWPDIQIGQQEIKAPGLLGAWFRFFDRNFECLSRCLVRFLVVLAAPVSGSPF